MTKTGKKLAAVLLAVAMAITFMPVLGTQTVYADDYVWFSTPDGLNYGQDATSDGYTPAGYDGGVYVSSYDGNASRIEIPPEVTYNGKRYCVTMIGPGGLSYSDEHAPENLVYVVLPDTIRWIDSQAFMGTKIMKIDLPDGLEWIEDQAFMGSGLTGTLIIPESVEGIGREAFMNCSVDNYYCRTPAGQYMSIGERAFGYYSLDDGSYNKKSIEFTVFEDSHIDKWAKENGFDKLNYLKGGDFQFTDMGSFELDLSREPLIYEPEKDPTRHMQLAYFLFAYGSENPDSFLTEGFGPDHMAMDIDKNGTWDLEMFFFGGEDEHFYCKYQRAPDCSVEGTVTVKIRNPGNRAIELGTETLYSSVTVKLSEIKASLNKESYTYDGKAKKPSVTVKATYPGGSKTLKEGTDYKVAYAKGRINAGKYEVSVTLNNGQKFKQTFTINKAANPLTMKAKTATVKYSKLKKKNQTLAVTKVITFTKKGQGTMSYTLVSAKKGSKSFKKYFKIGKTTGKVTIKKNSKMKKGTYKVMVKVKAAGNTNYKPSAVKTVTFKVKVK